MMTALNIGPVSIAIEADKSAFQLYRSGVMDDYAGCGQVFDHGVLAVGYGTLNGSDYYKVKNSWGASWGLHGYILMGRGPNYTNGMCGMLKSASYPTGGHTVQPGPKPTPGEHHYGKPTADGVCEDGDHKMDVPGESGSFCSPKCKNDESCPPAPNGWGGLSECTLRDTTTGEQYCAVECFGLTGDCGTSGATCQTKSGQYIGICLYPTATKYGIFTPKNKSDPRH
jgi:hypothetical protein